MCSSRELVGEPPELLPDGAAITTIANTSDLTTNRSSLEALSDECHDDPLSTERANADVVYDNGLGNTKTYDMPSNGVKELEVDKDNYSSTSDNISPIIIPLNITLLFISGLRHTILIDRDYMLKNAICVQDPETLSVGILKTGIWNDWIEGKL
jgi:hypothetical protein